MGALDQQQQQQQPQESRASDVSQQLEASNVDLPPEETTTTNISQLIELDLLGDKDKKKNDDDSDEEVSYCRDPQIFAQYSCTYLFIHFKLTEHRHRLILSRTLQQVAFITVFNCVFLCQEEAQGGDQDQEERRWNKRTQQMLHGLQVCTCSHLSGRTRRTG